jgi:hypothetical protein
MQKFCLKFFDEESDKEDFDLSNKTENVFFLSLSLLILSNKIPIFAILL